MLLRRCVWNCSSGEQSVVCVLWERTQANEAAQRWHTLCGNSIWKSACVFHPLNRIPNTRTNLIVVCSDIFGTRWMLTVSFIERATLSKMPACVCVLCVYAVCSLSKRRFIHCNLRWLQSAQPAKSLGQSLMCHWWIWRVIGEVAAFKISPNGQKYI